MVGQITNGTNHQSWWDKCCYTVKICRLSLSEFKLATSKTLGYDMPRVSLKVICTARFWWALSQNQTMFHLRWVSADGGHFEHTCELGSRA